MSKETARGPGTAPRGLPLPPRRKARSAGRVVSGDVKKCYNMTEIYLRFSKTIATIHDCGGGERIMESNFTFLRERFPVLARFGEQAERYFRSDANSCLMKLGMIGETIVHLIYDTDGIELPVPDDAVHRIRRLAREDYIPRDIESILHTLRKKRNLAVHESYDSAEDARVLLPLAYTLAE